MTSSDTTPETPAAPLLRLVRGAPSPEEMAAVVAVLASRGGAAEEPAPAPRPLWSRPQTRPPLSPGPGAWRASGLSH